MKRMTAMSMYFRTLRGRHDLTQPYVAEQVGVDKGTVWRWENEGRRPEGPALSALLDLLHGHMDDIRAIDADPDNVAKGEQLAEWRYRKYQDRVGELAQDPDPDIDKILDQLREEAHRNPTLRGLLRSLLTSLGVRDGDQSR